MTQIAIQQQVDAIKQATKEASKTKETARQFLIDAGILHPSQNITSKPKEGKK